MIVSMVRLMEWRDLSHSGGGKKEEQAFRAKEQVQPKDGSCRSWRKDINRVNLTKGWQKILGYLLSQKATKGVDLLKKAVKQICEKHKSDCPQGELGKKGKLEEKLAVR